MDALLDLARIVVQITGPLMLACIVIMYISVTLTTRKFPMPTRMMYLYVNQNIAKRQHAGILTYLFLPAPSSSSSRRRYSHTAT